MVAKRNFFSVRARRAGLVSAIALAAALPGYGQDSENCRLVDGVLPETCEQPNKGIVVRTPFEGNQESDAPADGPEGFSISIGGTTIAGDETDTFRSTERAQDISLDAADVQVRYDGLQAERRLNVLTADLRTEFRGGETVTFRPSMNYRRYVDRAEIRITPVRRGLGQAETLVLPADPNGLTNWTMPEGEAGDFVYSFRVYDKAGRYDETAPALVARRSTPVMPDLNGPVTAAGELDDRTARQSIPISGGMVTVLGEGLPSNARVTVMGRSVPVDPTGRFATEIVLPAGEHMVAIGMEAPGASGVTLRREIDIPRDDWFVTGLADFTIGRRGTSISSGDTYTLGQVGLYARGVVGGRTRVIASVDTGDEELEDLFDDALTKDPRAVLKRIDPDNLYPTYGDDSSIVDDAPTSGKVYVRVEEGNSHVMWGDFKNDFGRTGWMSDSRELYGAQGVYGSPEVTVDGEHRLAATVYAANPDSLPQRDQLRGTGGSVYVLQRRDLVPGSEDLTIELTDPVTGRVVSSQVLEAGEDYRIDYFQGTVILTSPLSGNAFGGGIGGGSLTANLVAQYEYVPPAGNLDGAAIGGRVETWLPGDMVRLGVTAMDETTDTADLNVVAADVRLKFSEGSFIDAEVAESRGTGFGRSISSDGGFTWVPVASGGSVTRAQAVRVEGQLDLADLGGDGMVRAYYEDKDRGFSTLSEDTAADTRLWGIEAEAALSARASVALAYEDYDNAAGDSRKRGEARIGYDLGRDLTLDLGLAHVDQVKVGDPDDTGRRTDLGLRLTREFANDQSVYVFRRGTVDRSGTIRRDDRYGIGGRFALSDRVAVEGEVSGGTNGTAGRALVDYAPVKGTRFYLGYELDPNRDVDGTSLNGGHDGTFVIGAERAVDTGLSFFAENAYDLFGARRSLTSAYGVTYTPGERWSYSADLEFGRVTDSNDPDFDRFAAGAGVEFDDGDGRSGSARLEYRKEDETGATTRDRETWAFVGSYSHQVSEDWRLLASLDALISESDQSSFLDGRYVEASLGYAYRPVANDRLNVLARYSYLYDLPGADQVSSDGTSTGDKQRSHIFSLDGIYEVSDRWELGGKIAYRIGETAPRTSATFTSNDAGLIALRATYALPHTWEISGEARVLVMPDNDATETGALLTVYRSFGNNAKVGLGYNFGNFSDDLRDTTLNDRGIFLNVQAKF